MALSGDHITADILEGTLWQSWRFFSSYLRLQTWRISLYVRKGIEFSCVCYLHYSLGLNAYWQPVHVFFPFLGMLTRLHETRVLNCILQAQLYVKQISMYFWVFLLSFLDFWNARAKIIRELPGFYFNIIGAKTVPWGTPLVTCRRVECFTYNLRTPFSSYKKSFIYSTFSLWFNSCFPVPLSVYRATLNQMSCWHPSR